MIERRAHCQRIAPTADRRLDASLRQPVRLAHPPILRAAITVSTRVSPSPRRSYSPTGARHEVSHQRPEHHDDPPREDVDHEAASTSRATCDVGKPRPELIGPRRRDWRSTRSVAGAGTDAGTSRRAPGRRPAAHLTHHALDRHRATRTPSRRSSSHLRGPYTCSF